MIRLTRKHRLQNRHRPQPTRIRLVVQVFGGRERERIEKGGFRVIRIAARDLRHGVAIGFDARLLGAPLCVSVEIGDGINEQAFAIGLRADRAGPLHRRQPLLHLARRAQAHGKRIRPPTERDPPLRHRARRVLPQRRLKCGDRLSEFE